MRWFGRGMSGNTTVGRVKGLQHIKSGNRAVSRYPKDELYKAIYQMFYFWDPQRHSHTA